MHKTAPYNVVRGNVHSVSSKCKPLFIIFTVCEVQTIFSLDEVLGYELTQGLSLQLPSKSIVLRGSSPQLWVLLL